MKSQRITLNEREYTIYDMGEGDPFLLIKHQSIIPIDQLKLIIENRSQYGRVIIVDITERLPSDGNLVTLEQLEQLVNDLHLLCDIYWLDCVEVRSYYCPDIIQEKMKAQLGLRIITPNSHV